MRGIIQKLLACLLAFGFTVAFGEAPAASRIIGKKPAHSRVNADKAYSLEDIMKDPEIYIEREVFFYSRFASPANLFKNVNTRFNANEHANFAVWPDKTVLWESEARKNILPTLYIPKVEPKLLDILRGLKRYELIAITGVVLNVYAKCPWILVTKIERVELPSDRLSEPVIQHMQNGHEALRANFGGVAARHYEQALMFGLPPEYRAKAYHQLAKAYLLDNQLDKARDYLRLAVECDRTDSLLHLALADVAIRIGDPDEALAHCVFALENSGKLPQIYGLMGEAKAMTGQYVNAFEDLNIAANTPGITPREKAMINVRRARIYAKAERYSDAARIYADMSNPGQILAGDIKLLNEIGLFYEMRYLDNGEARTLDSAYEAYEGATKLNQNDVTSLYNLAEAEFRRQKARQKASELPEYEQTDGPNYELAEELVNEIFLREPEFTPARILQGRIFHATGRTEQGDESINSVKDQIGSNGVALLALAEAYLEFGMNREAGAAIRRAMSIQPWNPRIQALAKKLEKQASLNGESAKSATTNGTYPGASNQNGQNGHSYDEIPHSRGVVNPAVRPGSQILPPERGPVSANLIASNGLIFRSGDTRLGENGTIEPGPANARLQPQEIQASVKSASVTERQVPPYPVSQVHLPEYRPSQAGGGRLRPPPEQSSGRIEPAPASEAAPRLTPTPLNLDFIPRNQNGSENTAGPRVTDDFRDDFDLDFNSGFPGFSKISGVDQAYASLPAGNGHAGGGAPLAIPVFSFESGTSPVIISGLRAPAEANRDMPVRNANLFRSAGGSRQPAEITEKEPIQPHPLFDVSTLTVPGDGNLHRTSVRLPTSAKGIGISSDYRPAP
ncbi:MAG: hypothetical protein FWG74_08375 [Planctomycetes bacterium]|nr:hypothetical protein [Planctomycetota bacterium]